MHFQLKWKLKFHLAAVVRIYLIFIKETLDSRQEACTNVREFLNWAVGGCSAYGEHWNQRKNSILFSSPDHRNMHIYVTLPAGVAERGGDECVLGTFELWPETRMRTRRVKKDFTLSFTFRLLWFHFSRVFHSFYNHVEYSILHRCTRQTFQISL